MRRSFLKTFFQEYPLGVLLAALLLMMIGAPAMSDITHHVARFRGQASMTPLILILTVAAGYAIWPTTRYRASSVFFGALVLAILVLSTIFRHDALAAMHLVAQAFFLTYVAGVVLRAVFQAEIVDGNILCGAACLYLLAGVLSGFIYSLIEVAMPGSFVIMPVGGERPPSHPTPAWLMYFSFSTLTTVGFSDVMPACNIARSLAVLEAVIGQIMVVVMIARLVGLHVAQASVGKHKITTFAIAEKPKRKDAAP
jgi:hypothetical protein